jgi:hypothetical protein
MLKKDRYHATINAVFFNTYACIKIYRLSDDLNYIQTLQLEGVHGPPARYSSGILLCLDDLHRAGDQTADIAQQRLV